MSQIRSLTKYANPITYFKFLKTIAVFSFKSNLLANLWQTTRENFVVRRQWIPTQWSYCIWMQNIEKSTENLILGELTDLFAVLWTTKIQFKARAKKKGFLGVISRWHFHRGPISHGSTHHRKPGSIGAGTTPGRVLKGKKLPGRKKVKYINHLIQLSKQVLIKNNYMTNTFAFLGSFVGGRKCQVQLLLL